jgi:acetyltransferase-like isoleucine patch superfamily enzyme
MEFVSIEVVINQHPEMANSVSGHAATCVICSHCYIQTRQICQDVDNLPHSSLEGGGGIENESML